MPGPALIASRVAAALSDRTWGVGDPHRCHLVLLFGGSATLRASSPGGGSEIATAIASPAMLWVPHSVRGRLVIAAGGEGYGASIGIDFLQRAVGDPALAVHLRPLLCRTVLAGPELLTPRVGTLASVFAALVEEAQGGQAAVAEMAGLQVATMLLWLWRCAATPPGAGRRGAGSTTAQRFRRLVELHYRGGLGIDDFADRLGVSRAHLHDACVRATGRTPLALVHDRVMAEARTRLEQTDLSVEQVGYGLGFRDPGYFNRFFRRLSGQTPGAFRRSAARSRTSAATPSFAAWP